MHCIMNYLIIKITVIYSVSGFLLSFKFQRIDFKISILKKKCIFSEKLKTFVVHFDSVIYVVTNVMINHLHGCITVQSIEHQKSRWVLRINLLLRVFNF